MKQIFAVVILAWIGATTWVVTDLLTADAVAMGVGVVLGVAAGLPVALLLLASQRRSERRQTPPEADRHRPPVVVLYNSRAQPSGHLSGPARRQAPSGRLPGPVRRQAPPIGLDARYRIAADSSRQWREWEEDEEEW